jgi:hypothetical protein
VRIAHIDRQPGKSPTTHDGFEGRCAAAQPDGLAHVDGDIGVGRIDVVQRDRPRAGQ